MQNVLYIGPYKENNGLGRSSRRYISCLASNPDINLSCRPIYFTSNLIEEPDEKIDNKFEQNSSTQYDAVIQHGYPDMFEYHRKFGKNIGIAPIETMNIGHSGWIEKINLMDEVIVGSTYSEISLIESGVTTPIKATPEPFNIGLMTEKHDLFFQHLDNDPFVFYTIGQYTEQKNIKAIVVAFLLEFNEYDNVRLFIKTGHHRIDNNTLEHKINYDINYIREAIRKNENNSAPIDIMCGPMFAKDIRRLHHSCHCYIDATKADHNGACAIEALLSDSKVVVTENGASNSFINPNNGYVVRSGKTNVYTADTVHNNIFTIHEYWYEPSINYLQQSMRSAFNDAKKTISIDKDLFDKDRIAHIII
jgi:glycosyltransferase involved in cell wall biosynthesis